MADADAGINSKIRYSFVERDGDGSNRFQINRQTGEVISTASFLGQAGASFQLVVKATDKDGKGLSATKTLVVSFDPASYLAFPVQRATIKLFLLRVCGY